MNEIYMTSMTDVNMRAFEDYDDYIIARIGENFFKIIKDTNQVFFKGYDEVITNWKEKGVLIPLLIEM